jgi:hypothetical protein
MTKENFPSVAPPAKIVRTKRDTIDSTTDGRSFTSRKRREGKVNASGLEERERGVAGVNRCLRVSLPEGKGKGSDAIPMGRQSYTHTMAVR